MPDKDIFEETQSALADLEEKIGGEYPEVAETLGQAQMQLEEAHGAMGEEGEEGLPPDLEGEELPEGDEEELGGPLGELPPDLEEEEEDLEEPLPEE
jgi:hypothetical protein